MINKQFLEMIVNSGLDFCYELELNSRPTIRYDRGNKNVFYLSDITLNLMSNIKNVYFNEEKATTVVVWSDGVKTKVKCDPRDAFDKEKGLAMCIIKRINGGKGSFNEVFKKWCPDEEEEAK